MRHRLFFIVAFLLLAAGCGKKNAKSAENIYEIYYLNRNETGLIKEVYEADSTEQNDLIRELMAAMRKPQDEKEQLPLLEDIYDIQSFRCENMNVQLDMKSGYGELPKTKEVLIRAGMVRVLTQIEEIDSVTFSVDGSPLLDSKGMQVGVLNEQSFIENSGEQINTYKSETLTLYFANEEGNGLKAERRKLYYSSNDSLEQVVVEQLLKGPKEADCYKTLPDNAKIMNVTVADKICYVNFDKAFADNALNIQEQIPIYSIVNSIIENCSVRKVQISIAGESNLIFRETMKLSELYSMNRDLIQNENQ